MKRLAIALMALLLPAGFSHSQTLEESERLKDHIRRAMKHKAEGQPKQQAEQLELALPLIERILGSNSDQTQGMMNDLASLYSELGHYAKAEPLYLRCLELREATLGREHPKTATTLNNLALLYEQRGQYAKAEPMFLRALAISETKRGKDDPETATVLDNLAGLYSAKAHYAQAEKLSRRSLTIREARQGADHPSTAVSLNNLALLHMKQGQHHKADPLLQRCVRICETQLGKDHPKTAAALENLATLRDMQARYAEAEPLYQRSLAIREAKLGKDHPSTAMCLGNLGDCYRSLGQYVRAESMLRRSLEMIETALGKDHPETARLLDNLGVLYQTQGHYAKAEPAYRRALEIRETQLGKDHPDTARSLNNLANLQNTQGQHARAEPMLRRALQISEARLGKDHPETARAVENLAALYHQQLQYARAEPLYLRALESREKQLGKDHPDLTATLNNLASLCNSLSEHAKAEALYQRCLTICENSLGKDHPTLAVILNNLAFAHQAQGKLDQAESLFRRSLAIHEAKLDKDHPRTAFALHNLAALEVRSQRWADAIQHTDRARRTVARHIAAALPALSEPEQLLFLDKVEQQFHPALSVGLLRRHDPEAAAASAAWLLNGRAVSHQTLAEQHVLARTAATSTARALLEQLKQTRDALAALQHRPAAAGQEEAAHERSQELRKRERDLARKLAREIGRPFRDDPWIELTEVRKKLSAQAVLVDIARIRVFDFAKDRSQAARYLAWITPPEGKGAVQIVDLGQAELIDAAVMQARRAIVKSAAGIRERGEPDAVKDTVKPLSDLAKLVLHPLLDAVGEYKELVLCPDGALWLAPWNALPLPNGKQTVEAHVLRFVISGRDLVSGRSEHKSAAAYVFADPDFDLSPAEVRAKTHTLLRGLGAIQLPSLTGRRLKGTIGDWNVSFEFKDRGELLIRDEDAGGEVAGTGRWSQARDKVIMETSQACFEGTMSGNMVAGQRKLDAKSDRWQFRLPADEAPAPVEDGSRSAGSASHVLPRALRLPGTAVEVELVIPKIKLLLAQTPRLYTGAQAGEALVKAVERPSILMLSTHGYFLTDQEVKQQDKNLPLEGSRELRSTMLISKRGERIENPLLRCGLLLAGCNKRDLAQSGDDDGILTGLEIVGMDLRGTELVVLSACETGIGDIRNGEGVAGLRQAFMLAGAETVLASLWQVSDRETALLMSAFFTNMSKGRSRAEALRNAQLERIEARRRQFGAAHPFYWAAFNLTGK